MANRRKFLAGLGALASGSAAAVGTGAFTSVTADRDVTVNVTGDANALLSITKAEEGGNVTPNAEEYVNISNDGIVSLDFSGTQLNEAGNNSNGLNQDATTIFDNLLDFTNQGTQDIRVGEQSVTSHPGSFYVENTQGDDTDNSSFDVDDFDNSPQNVNQTIAPGESLTNIGFFITDPGSDLDFTVTFEATRVGGNRD